MTQTGVPCFSINDLAAGIALASKTGKVRV